MESLNIKLNAQDAIDIMFEPVFVDKDMMADFAIVKNLFAGEYKIGLLSAIKNVTGKLQACSPKYKGTSTMSERSLVAQYVEAGTKMCYEEFINTHYDLLAPLYTTAKGNPDLTILLNLLTKQLGEGIRRDVNRVAWFGDVADADDNLNWADGIFKYLDQLVTAGTIGAYTNSNQGTALTNQQAYELLQDVVNAAPAALKTMPGSDKVIHISGLLWDKVVTYLEDNAVTSGFIRIFEEQIQGLVGSYRGIKVKAHYEWDEISNEYFGLVDQNKIVYTHKSNMVIGTDLRPDATGGASFFKVYQNPETDEITLRAKFVFNTNYVWSELFSVGL
jgi:hypothetical protein